MTRRLIIPSRSPWKGFSRAGARSSGKGVASGAGSSAASSADATGEGEGEDEGEAAGSPAPLQSTNRNGRASIATSLRCLSPMVIGDPPLNGDPGWSKVDWPGRRSYPKTAGRREAILGEPPVATVTYAAVTSGRAPARPTMGVAMKTLLNEIRRTPL